jgi:hypothetical protein
MASKKSKRGARKGSKTAFILSLPADMPASEAVAKAAAAGIKVSDKYVYNIRSANRGKPAEAKRGPGRPPKAGRGARRAAKRGPGRPRGAGGDLEAQLRGAIAELGLARARAVLDEVATAFGR